MTLVQVLYRIRATSEVERRPRRDIQEEEEWQRGSAVRSLLLAEQPTVSWVNVWTLVLLASVLGVALLVVAWRLRHCRTSYELEPTSVATAS